MLVIINNFVTRSYFYSDICNFIRMVVYAYLLFIIISL